MNALFELVGTTISGEQFDAMVKEGNTFNDCIVSYKEEKLCRGVRTKVLLLPKFHSETFQQWIQKVKFATISKIAYYTEDSDSFFLRSDRSKDDEREFYEFLKSIEYDEGYGTQELFGFVVFNDHSWLERGEYDGSEWWQLCEEPKEEELLKQHSNEN